MFLERPKEIDNQLKKQKKITLRVPDKLWSSIQEKAKREYEGRGKQSQLVNEALEHFDKSADKIEGIIFNEIKTFIDKKIDVHSLPKIVTATDIEEFKDSILDSINEYPVLIEYTETLDFTLVHWEPMYLAIRRYFNVGVISKISSRDEFLLALIGYRNLEYIYYDHLEQMPKKEIHSEINMLVKNSFATLDEAQELKDLKLLWPE